MDTMETIEKPKKRVMTETQLKALAEGRKRALETRKKGAEIKKVLKQEQKENLEKVYDKIVLKKFQLKKSLDINLPDGHDPSVKDESDEEVESNITEHVQPKPSKVAKPQELNYKQLYYKHKLDALTQQQQQHQFNQNYSQLPIQNHAIDIAKHTIKNKANQLVFENVMKSLFPTG